MEDKMLTLEDFESMKTRQQILQLLLKENLDITELSRGIGISTISVRQHLMVLENKSFVEKVSVKSKVGRPKYVYALTGKAHWLFPKAYDNLLEGVIKRILEKDGEKGFREIITGVAKENAFAFKSQFEGKTLEEKIDRIVKILNGSGAYVEAEKVGDRFLIKTYNCLFRKTALKFGPSVCDYDIVFLETLLRSRVNYERHEVDGRVYCSFEVGADKESGG